MKQKTKADKKQKTPQASATAQRFSSTCDYTDQCNNFLKIIHDGQFL